MGTTTKTRRLELRTDEATDQLISEAADLLHVTKSAFVADAARKAAEKIVARSDVTHSVTSPVYRVTKLTPSYDLSAFDCGEPSYNQWLVQHAANAVEAGSSMVYLLLQQAYPGAEERVVGYYAICPTGVVRDDIPESLQRGVLPAAPAWLLAKHALDGALRGDEDRQWGAQLLREALERIVASGDLGGGQIIVVDADKPGLITWYSRQGFKSTGGQDLRLSMKVAIARKYLEQK